MKEVPKADGKATNSRDRKITNHVRKTINRARKSTSRARRTRMSRTTSLGRKTNILIAPSNSSTAVGNGKVARKVPNSLGRRLGAHGFGNTLGGKGGLAFQVGLVADRGAVGSGQRRGQQRQDCRH